MTHVDHSTTRGEDRGWLKAQHTSAFADYDDPARMRLGLAARLETTTDAAQHGLSAAPPREPGNHHLLREGAVTHKALGKSARTEAEPSR